jgi:hypothetical protein
MIMSYGLVKDRILPTKGKRWVENVANMGERCVQVLVGKHEGKKLLGRTRPKWEDNTKIGRQEVG